MTSSTPTPKVEPQDQATPGGHRQGSWWREWLKPIVAVVVASLLVGSVTLVANVWMGSFASLRADIRDGNARLSEQITVSNAQLREEIRATDTRPTEQINQRIDEVKEEVRASEARVRDELKASEARQAQRTDGIRADVKALRTDNRALGEK